MSKLGAGLTLLALALVALLPMSVYAHGGGIPRVTAAPAGDYRVYVWTDPASPRRGDTLHVTVGLTLPEANGLETPVTDAAVRVEFRGPEQESTVVEARPGAAAGGVFYEADTRLDAEGEWSVMVLISGERGSGEFPAGVTVGPALFRMSWNWIAIAAGLLSAGAVTWVLLRRARTRRQSTMADAGNII